MPQLTRRTRRRGQVRVLIVEDSPTDLMLMQRLLDRLGCKADVAADGQRGIEAACTGDYDFIFMDLEMPKVDGWEATRWIHRTIGPASPFIAAVTSHHSDQDNRKCADAGIDYVLPKPVTLASLTAMIEP